MTPFRFLAAALALSATLAAQPNLGHGKITLKPIWTHASGVFDDAAAEIVAHDPTTQCVFVTNASTDKIDVLDARTGANLGAIDVSAIGSPNSVAVHQGLVAVALEASVVTSPGQVAFYTVQRQGNTCTSALAGTVQVGALPDMLTFTPDGQSVVVACEGEPDNGIDPVGEIAIVDVSNGPAAATAKLAGFGAFDGREDELRARGVRIFPNMTASKDFEPEYVAVAPDGQTAFATLQEASAVAVVDIANAKILDVLPMGLKDHSRGDARVETYTFDNLPYLAGATLANQQVRLGGFSGLYYVGKAGKRLRFVTIPDRGPNPATFTKDVGGGPGAETVRPLALPNYQARLVFFELDQGSGKVDVTDQLFLTRRVGNQLVPITGRPNLVFDTAGNQIDEYPVDMNGSALPLDPFGGDFEGVVIAPDGSFWMCDEYRPAVYHFDTAGVLIDRYVPAGTAALGGQAVGSYGSETLPAEYVTRRRNRGFEAIALDPTNGIVYAFIQTPLANPNRAASDNSDVIRILALRAADGVPVAEYVYLLEGADYRESKVDKIGDAVWHDGKLLVLERDSAVSATAKKFLFEVDLRHATNVLGAASPPLLPGKTLEEHTADELVAQGIRAADKRKVTNLPSIGYLAGDKPEGIAVIDDRHLAVLNDNDFQLTDDPLFQNGTGAPLTNGAVIFQANPTPEAIGIISFPRGNTLDASDRDARGSQDSTVRLRNWPVFGLHMPDAIAAFSVGGQTYYATANEGDDRGEDERIKDLVLDPTVFPNASWLQEDGHIGRLGASSIDGDLDGDNDHDRLFAYGARSFTILDAYGNLVWDSGDMFERITARRLRKNFNATNDENDFDSRSDAKGPEPEAVTTGVIDGRTFAFIGLERVGGIMIFDVTQPSRPRFVDYVNNRDFNGDPELGTAGDLGPEGLAFVSRADSPIGAPLLIVANEVSGTTTAFRIQRPGNGNGRGKP